MSNYKSSDTLATIADVMNPINKTEPITTNLAAAVVGKYIPYPIVVIVTMEKNKELSISDQFWFVKCSNGRSNTRTIKAIKTAIGRIKIVIAVIV